MLSSEQQLRFKFQCDATRVFLTDCPFATPLCNGHVFQGEIRANGDGNVYISQWVEVIFASNKQAPMNRSLILVMTHFS